MMTIDLFLVLADMTGPTSEVILLNENLVPLPQVDLGGLYCIIGAGQEEFVYLYLFLLSQDKHL